MRQLLPTRQPSTLYVSPSPSPALLDPGSLVAVRPHEPICPVYLPIYVDVCIILRYVPRYPATFKHSLQLHNCKYLAVNNLVVSSRFHIPLSTTPLIPL